VLCRHVLRQSPQVQSIGIIALNALHGFVGVATNARLSSFVITMKN
jgi:hypothetical protein